ncbi:hypothetical protein CSUI_007787 [Cystoisospora suis]|uniref:Uncharacterized protein n=1 Tax=Cystoisospora suis TaxID=483139 RepID=A0A2C6KCE7_9APIC|nr:hypothetical protein CSUI_007787 [Cystoisospora suis]
MYCQRGELHRDMSRSSLVIRGSGRALRTQRWGSSTSSISRSLCCEAASLGHLPRCRTLLQFRLRSRSYIHFVATRVRSLEPFKAES